MRTLGHHYSSLLEKLNSGGQEINMMTSTANGSMKKKEWEERTQHQKANAGFTSGDMLQSSAVTFQHCCYDVSMRNIQPCSPPHQKILTAVALLQRSPGVGGHPSLKS
jgi:hypothetical protein